MSGDQRQFVERYRDVFIDEPAHLVFGLFVNSSKVLHSPDELARVIAVDHELCAQGGYAVTFERYLQALPALRVYLGIEGQSDDQVYSWTEDETKHVLSTAIRSVLLTISREGESKKQAALWAQAIRAAYPGVNSVLKAVYESLFQAEADNEPFPLESDTRVKEGQSNTADVEYDENGHICRINQYKLGRVLGKGQFAIVRQAHALDQDSRTKKHVAIKLYVDLVEDGVDSRHMCAHEYSITQKLDHSSVVRVHECGVIPGSFSVVPYLVMEHIDGALPIDEYLRFIRGTRRQRVELFTEACEALEYVHDNNQAHGDLSPNNIQIDKSGRLKVIDFGLASQIREFAKGGVSDCASPWSAGTRGFRAPETYGLEASYASLHLCDMYSLGVLLYLLLTEELPYDFKGLSDQSIVDLISTEPPEFSNSVPLDLQAIIRAAMHRNPSSRYGTVRELRKDLERYLYRLPVTVRPLSTVEEYVSVMRRHPVVGIGLMSLFVLLMLASVSGIWLNADAIKNRRASEDFISLLDVMRKHLSSDQLNRSVPSARMLHWLPKDRTPDGQGRVVVLSHDHKMESSVLVIYDHEGNDLKKAVNPPLEIPGIVSNTYTQDRSPRIVGGLVADVLSEYPGDELVLLQQHRRMYPAVMRIFSFENLDKPLVEVWNQGQWYSVTWDEPQRRLVLAAVSNKLAACWPGVAEWDAGWADQRAHFIHPSILVTLDPEQLPQRSVLSPIISNEMYPSTPTMTMFTMDHPVFPTTSNEYGQTISFADMPQVHGGIADVVVRYRHDDGENRLDFFTRSTIDEQGRWLNAWSNDSGHVYRKGVVLPERLIQIEPDEMQTALGLIEPLIEKYHDPRVVLGELDQLVSDSESVNVELAKEIVLTRDRSSRWLYSEAYSIVMNPGEQIESYLIAIELIDRAVFQLPEHPRESAVFALRCVRAMGMARAQSVDSMQLLKIIDELLEDRHADLIWEQRLRAMEALVLVNMGELDLARERVQRLSLIATEVGWNASEDIRDIELRKEAAHLTR